jgi:hypothetical protein
MIAGALEVRTTYTAFLTIYIGSFLHSRWFLIYPLLEYNIIFGQNFMKEVPQEIDLTTNVLQVPSCILRGLECNNRDCTGLLSKDEPCREVSSYRDRRG